MASQLYDKSLEELKALLDAKVAEVGAAQRYVRLEHQIRLARQELIDIKARSNQSKGQSSAHREEERQRKKDETRPRDRESEKNERKRSRSPVDRINRRQGSRPGRDQNIPESTDRHRNAQPSKSEWQEGWKWVYQGWPSS